MNSRFWRELDEAQHASYVAWVCSADEIDPRPGETDEVYPVGGVGVRATTPPIEHKPAPLTIGPNRKVFRYGHNGWLWHRRYANPIQGAKWYLLTKTPTTR